MNANIIGEMMDISEPETVQVQISADGKVLWVNVDGLCRFRACRIKHLAIDDDRNPMPLITDDGIPKPAEDPDS